MRAVATLDNQSHRAAEAIAWLKANYTKPFNLEKLATVLTSMSPLQDQKQLRLFVARERMLVEGLDASTAAFDVRYESATQFNREYKRLFDEPPMRHIRARRFSRSATI